MDCFERPVEQRSLGENVARGREEAATEFAAAAAMRGPQIDEHLDVRRLVLTRVLGESRRSAATPMGGG